jgi:Flp pilus assembly protein TadD
MSRFGLNFLQRGVAYGTLTILLGAPQILTAQTTTRKHITENPAASELGDLLNSAQAAIERQDFSAAAQNYQDYLAKKPDDATVHYDLGYVYTALHRPADARAEYQKATSLDPKMAEAYQNLGLTFMPDDPAEAVEPLQKAAELEPNDARKKWLLGTALEMSGKMGPAIEQFEAARELDDKDADIQDSLAQAYLTAGRVADAEAVLQTAMALNPTGPALANTRHGLAEVFIAEKKTEQGAAELEAYLALQPNDVAARVQHASLLLDLGKDDDALAELDRAAAATPETVPELKLRSQIYFDKKEYANAIPALQKAAAMAPQDPDIPARLGHLYLETKDYPNAVRALGAALKMDPGANDVLSEMIAAQYFTKNYQAALDGLDALAKREPLPAKSVFVQATCYDKLDELPQAFEAYNRFLKLNTDTNNDMYFDATDRVRAITRELQQHKR